MDGVGITGNTVYCNIGKAVVERAVVYLKKKKKERTKNKAKLFP